METLHIVLIILGLSIFLTGYWYLAKSSGERECTTPIASSSLNFILGWINLLLGIIIVFIAYYLIKTTTIHLQM